MQKDALVELGKHVASEDDPSPFLIEFGFYYPFEYVRRTYIYLQRGWGWPEGEGWAQQDQRLLDDLDTYFDVYLPISKAAQSGNYASGDAYEDQETAVERRRLGQDEL